MGDIEKEPYFYGNISREESEVLLWDRGCLNGMYLLRSSTNKDADFVLSLCFDKSVYHYRIKRSVDGLYFVHGAVSEKFSTLKELVGNISGLICRPAIACNKPFNNTVSDRMLPLSEDSIQEAIRQKAKEWGLEENELHKALNGNNEELLTIIMKTLHESLPWFHGKISRTTAEQRLLTGDNVNGKFLIRERNDCTYALCLSFESEIKHYMIEVTSAGEYRIQDGPRFENLVQLVSHYSALNDGLWCCLAEACPHPSQSGSPEKYSIQNKLEELLSKPPQSCKGDENKRTSLPSPSQNDVLPKLTILHQPAEVSTDSAISSSPSSPKPDYNFANSVISNQSSESGDLKNSSGNINKSKILPSLFGRIVSGPADNSKQNIKGKTKKTLMPFRRRESDSKAKNKKEEMDIENIKRENNKEVNDKSDVVDHNYSVNRKNNVTADLNPVIKQLQQRLSQTSIVANDKLEMKIQVGEVHDEPVYQILDPDYEGQKPNEHHSKAENLAESLINNDVEISKWDEDNENKYERKRLVSVTRKPTWTKEESENHFLTIQKYRKNPMSIHSKNIVLKEKLGSGNFGEVHKAYFKSDNIEVPFAAKMLKSPVASAKSEMLHEAHLMTGLDHPNIVRLIGICEEGNIMLVLELAPLGPLNLYLKNHNETTISDVLQLMLQVALGMEYLEGRQFVHRDLAARNVLLVNENFAKISDFGMSKALGLDQDYYRMQPSGKLPLKWYAPECIYYFKFSSKSDVWSYGITLWEALSYGQKPYLGMTGQEILKMFSENKRLEKPPKCSDEVYSIMMECWKMKPEDRPSFTQIYRLLRNTVKMT